MWTRRQIKICCKICIDPEEYGLRDALDSGTSELLDEVVFGMCGLENVLTKRSGQCGLWDVWVWDVWNFWSCGIVDSQKRLVSSTCQVPASMLRPNMFAWLLNRDSSNTA